MRKIFSLDTFNDITTCCSSDIMNMKKPYISLQQTAQPICVSHCYLLQKCCILYRRLIDVLLRRYFKILSFDYWVVSAAGV